MKKFTLLALVLGFALLLGGAGLLYNRLAPALEDDRLGPAAQPEVTPEPTPEPTPEAEPVQAPDFTVYDGAGNPVKLSDYFGKPIVINFWASWCGPCQSEMPDFQKVWEELGDRVQFLMINMTDGSRETQATAEQFILEKGYSFPVYFDTTMEAAMTYGAYSLPTSYFINAAGEPVTYAEGAISEALLRKGIGMILPEV